jgi:MFS family permease
MEISDMLPHLQGCADDIALIRSMYGEHANHEPALFLMHTGRTIASRPSMGAWITLGYVLATLLMLLVGYIADRTMQRSLTGAAVSLGFAILVLPVLALSPEGSAVALSALIAVAGATAALNGAEPIAAQDG